MRAMVYERYGRPEVLEMREVETPTLRDNDLLVKVAASSLNRSDWETLVGSPLYARLGGLRRPANPILGTDVAGTVEAVGSSVKSFSVGDEVFGDLMYHGGKAFAEYVRVPETAPIVHKPPSLTFAQAATLPQSGAIALSGLSGLVGSGDRVLINGAGGGTGALAIQIAKSLGAEATGVDNDRKLDFMRSLGADHALDYAETDYTKSGPYDLILDLVCKRSMFAIRRAVAPGGRYSLVGGSMRALLSVVTLGPVLSTNGRRFRLLMVDPDKEKLRRIAGMVVDGTVRTTIERRLPLSELPRALSQLGEDRVLGKLVIEVL